MDEKINLILFYGGCSTEHEISCRSASFIIRHLDLNKYNLCAVAMTKDGRLVKQDAEVLLREKPEILPVVDQQVASDQSLNDILGFGIGKQQDQRSVVFPLIHGTFGEDGCLQGFLELCDIPYVGCDTLGSAVAMDKIIAKEIVKGAGVPVVPSVWLRSEEWREERSRWFARITEALRYPLFVKPARLGSSVGVSKVTNQDELMDALDLAFSYDDKVLVELGLKVREIEFAAIGDYKPRISGAGESIATRGFYDYEAKYQDSEASRVQIPAKISPALLEEGQKICKQVYQSLHLYGLARVDLFLTEDRRFYFNEVNTIPGFTSISQFPLLLKECGMSEGDIINHLVDSALRRDQTKKGLRRNL